MFAYINQLRVRFAARRHRAVDLTDVRARLLIVEHTLQLQVLSGRRTYLDVDGRTLVTDEDPRMLLQVPLEPAHVAAFDNPVLAAAFGHLNGRVLHGRVYLVDGRVEHVELSARDGSALTWSSRPEGFEHHP